MDFKLWKELLTESVYWHEFSDEHVFDMYQRTAVAWGFGDRYYIQHGPDSVDLTNILEQYKILSTLKGSHHGQNTNSEDC